MKFKIDNLKQMDMNLNLCRAVAWVGRDENKRNIIKYKWFYIDGVYYVFECFRSVMNGK